MRCKAKQIEGECGMNTLLIGFAFSAVLAVLVNVFHKQLTKLERLAQANLFESFVVFSLCLIVRLVVGKHFFGGEQSSLFSMPFSGTGSEGEHKSKDVTPSSMPL